MKTIKFQNIFLKVYYLDGQTYFAAADIGRALGSRASQAAFKVFYVNRNRFDGMTRRYLDPKANSTIRLFNIQGLSLIAELSDSSSATALKEWVLTMFNKEFKERVTEKSIETIEDGNIRIDNFIELREICEKLSDSAKVLLGQAYSNISIKNDDDLKGQVYSLMTNIRHSMNINIDKLQALIDEF